jgi:uncharacterized membrane protein
MSFFTENILTKEEMGRIAERIRLVEQETIGEIRVNVQKRRSWNERNMTVYDLAIKNFIALGMDATKQKTGVLIYLLLSDHAFQIIGDDGINKRVSQEFWDTLTVTMSDHFRKHKFFDGITRTIDEVGVVLKKEFPSVPGDTNELPDSVLIS